VEEVTEGLVKWFSAAKGYGFLQVAGQREDVFVHYSSIQTTGYRTLAQGDRVRCNLIDGPKGKMAIAVRRIEEGDDG
jgi:cold shock protein